MDARTRLAALGNLLSRLVLLIDAYVAAVLDKRFPTDLYFNFMLLQEEIGELAKAFAQRWVAQSTGRPDDALPAIREELADVLAYVIKLANYAGVDLEEAYLHKMQANEGRNWSTPAPPESDQA